MVDTPAVGVDSQEQLGARAGLSTGYIPGPRLSDHLLEAAEDAADEGGTQAASLVDAESPAAVVAWGAISWSM